MSSMRAKSGLAAACICMLFLCACQEIFKANPYRAGRIAVSMYFLSKSSGALSPEYVKAIETGYPVVNQLLGGDEIKGQTDYRQFLISKLEARFGGDPKKEAMLFCFKEIIAMYFGQLDAFFKGKADTEKLAILLEFNRGVNDAIRDRGMMKGTK